LTNLCKAYSVNRDLKSEITKLPLYDAFKYVIENYSTCLRDRSYNDINAILNITKLIHPEYIIVNEQKIINIAKICKEFMILLNKHKQHENMMQYVMKVDEYGHYITYKKGLKGLIAQILWHDIEGKYKLLKLQMAIDTALKDKYYGVELKKLFNGESEFDESKLECALPEPTGTHFGKENYCTEQLYPNGSIFPDTKCIYCGQEFYETQLKLKHLKSELGKHFYNGNYAVKQVITIHGKYNDDVEIFKLVKEKLYKWYGQHSKFLHTQRAKTKLLEFIAKYKSL
jgi:hypothetical protein